VFFFQAEDGIRDRNVTGVQTCALPIYVLDCAQRRGDADQRGGVDAAAYDRELRPELRKRACGRKGAGPRERDLGQAAGVPEQARSEERRVGKECGAREGWGQEKEK